MNYRGNGPHARAKFFILCQSPLRPLRNSHRRSLLTFCRGWRAVEPARMCVLVFLFLSCICTMRGRGREGEPERRGNTQREGNKKKWSALINQVKVQPVAGAAAIFYSFFFSSLRRVSRHLTLPSSPLLISSTSTSAGGGGGGCWRWAGGDSAPGCPLCQMRSVDISHQTGADQRPAWAHAGRRIKPHHAQRSLMERGREKKKKKNLSTRIKRLSQE